MEIIKTLLWILEIISAITIIILVLLQHGKGADVGATFGSSSGGSGSLFGSSGSSNFLSHTTAVFAVLFFVSTFALAMLSSNTTSDTGVMAHFARKPVASGTLTALPAMPAKATSTQNQIPN